MVSATSSSWLMVALAKASSIVVSSSGNSCSSSAWRTGGNLSNERDNANRGPQGTVPAGLLSGGKYPFQGTEEYTGPSEPQTVSVTLS